MKILSADQIRQADAFTIKHEGIKSIDLMLRAATVCFDWILENLDINEGKVHIFCGKGNNGGDGLVIAQLLSEKDIKTTVYIVDFSDNASADYLTNLKISKKKNIEIITLKNADFNIDYSANDLVIDAIFGTGLKRPVTGWLKEVITRINHLPIMILSIDIPSGLFCEFNHDNDFEAIVKADITLSFQQPKLAFVLEESGAFCGDWFVLDIDLDTEFIDRLDSQYYCIAEEEAWLMLKERDKFSHKGDFGHALIVAGSKGKMGAAVLSSKACLRSGVGLLTAYIPECGYNIFQTAVPEAMCFTSEIDNYLAGLPENLNLFTTIGIGPGIGTNKETIDMIRNIISKKKNPLVLDADALNILALDKKLLEKLPKNSILTPHPGEFRRLAGDWSTDKEKLELQKKFTEKYRVIVVLKGHHTCITAPGEHIYFNTSGNPGMATGGSGDVLLGIITALLASSYTPIEAACLGTFLHGRAGDLAAMELGDDSMISSDLIEYLPHAFLSLR